MLVLADEGVVPVDQEHEVVNVFHFPVPLYDVAVVAQRAPHHVHKVGPVLDVNFEDPRHLDHVLHGLDQGLRRGGFIFVVAALCVEELSQKEFNPEGRNGLGVRHGFLGPCVVQHLLVLVIMRVFEGGLVCLCVEPIDLPIPDILEEVGRQWLLVEFLEEPDKALIGFVVNPKVHHELWKAGLIIVLAKEHLLEVYAQVPVLLQRNLDLVPRYAEGAPGPLPEHVYVPVVLALYDREELVPDVCDVGAPVEDGEVIGLGALGKVDDLEVGPVPSLPRHEYDLVLLPLDDDLVADRDVVRALYHVLARVCPLVLQAKGHHEQRPAIVQDEMTLLSALKVLEVLRLVDSAGFARKAALVDRRLRSGAKGAGACHARINILPHHGASGCKQPATSQTARDAGCRAQGWQEGQADRALANGQERP
mmetsp:Transcript_59630/g.134325  ORF Transcript_59630/g.134325 Transcript_59630/m.134325 type:complete len:421 (+) Transcript_59630:761-2023(+)